MKKARDFRVPFSLMARHLEVNLASMWQRFTERARRVILNGQEEAGRLNSGYVGTEHLLLGLARETDGNGAAVLQQMGVSLEQLRTATLAAIAAPIDVPPQLGEPKLTPKAKRVLELAADEARRMRHNYIGTEHLLLALRREKDGMAATVLRALELNLENTRAQVSTYLEEKPAPVAAAVAATPPSASSVTAIVAGQFLVSLDVRALLDFAAQERRATGASQVELAHLLRAMCREESASARLLSEAGVDVEALRTRLKTDED